MIITAIEPKRKGLSAIYADGEFAIKADAETIIANDLTVGKEISYEELEELGDKSARKRCREKAFYLLGFRDHSRKDLLNKLKKDYPENIAEDTVDKMEELRLIDDISYAKRYSDDLINLKGLSKKGIKQKLIEKGIDRGIIDEVLDEIEIDEDKQIRMIIERKYLNVINSDKGRQRAVNGLLRLGYSYYDIKDALESLIEENED